MNIRPKKILIHIGLIIGILIMLEGLSRALLYRFYNREFDSSLIVDYKYFSSPGLRENSSGTVWGKPFHTDQSGGRINSRNDSAHVKWLYIGDSVTEGVGVGDSSTFTSICSSDLTDFNFLNLSLIGYSTADYYNALSSVLQSDTDVELVTLFYCLNDVYGKTKTNDLPIMARQDFLGAINSFLQERCAAYKIIKLLCYRNSDNYFRYDLQFYKKSDSHFIAAMNDLSRCDSICKAQNVYFNIVLLPYKSQLIANENYIPQQLVSEFCIDKDIEFSDASESLSKHTDINSLYLFADEIHFSAKGHQAVAEFLTR